MRPERMEGHAARHEDSNEEIHEKTTSRADKGTKKDLVSSDPPDQTVYGFFAMLDRMRLIRRWSLMFNLRTENLAEHSLLTAFVGHALASLRKLKAEAGVPVLSVDPGSIAVRCMFHDTTEIITGDLPTPVKYYDQDIREAYARVEDSASRRLLSFLPEELQPIYRPLLSPHDVTASAGTGLSSEAIAEELRFVEAADKLSAYIKCVQEVRAGNDEFAPAMTQTRDKIKTLDLPEAEEFLERFAPAFAYSLDELNPPQ